jgi:TPR repeat protein
MRSMSQQQQHLELPSLTDRTKHGSQDAQYQVGRCHLKGDDGGLPRSHDQSTDLFLRAAQQQGHVEAPCNLAAHAMTTTSHDNDDNDDENDVVALTVSTSCDSITSCCLGMHGSVLSTG